MRTILVTFGSYGDVQPMMGLGLALQQRGVEAIVMTNAYFEPVIRRAGLGFVPIGSAEQYEAVLAEADLWHPRRGLLLVTRAWVQLTPLVYEAIAEHCVPGETVVAATAVAFGARVAQERLGVPLATLQLQPAMFRSLFDTPRLPLTPPPRWQPRFVKRMLYWLADAVLDRAMAGEVNAYRGQFGLPPVRRLLQAWALSPQQVIGLFPEWFAPPQPDWPQQSLLAGFPLYEAADEAAETATLPSDVERFLRSGEPPIVFTFGTAMRHAASLFNTSVAACQLLGRRGLLVTRYAEQLPHQLPPNVCHVPYARFSQLLPRCAALVHHGGVGTTGQGLASGVPQLIMPMGFDQPDNAARAVRLGVARQVSPRAFRPQVVARLLSELIDRPSVAERCRHWAARSNDPERLNTACDAICRLASAKKQLRPSAD